MFRSMVVANTAEIMRAVNLVMPVSSTIAAGHPGVVNPVAIIECLLRKSTRVSGGRCVWWFQGCNRWFRVFLFNKRDRGWCIRLWWAYSEGDSIPSFSMTFARSSGGVDGKLRRWRWNQGTFIWSLGWRARNVWWWRTHRLHRSRSKWITKSMSRLGDFLNHWRGECLLKPSFKELVSEDKFDLGHMINNGVLGGLLFRGIISMGIAGRKVCTAVSREGNRIFGKEMV
jgi:hypothetical protein